MMVMFCEWLLGLGLVLCGRDFNSDLNENSFFFREGNWEVGRVVLGLYFLFGLG